MSVIEGGLEDKEQNQSVEAAVQSGQIPRGSLLKSVEVWFARQMSRRASEEMHLLLVLGEEAVSVLQCLGSTTLRSLTWMQSDWWHL